MKKNNIVLSLFVAFLLIILPFGYFALSSNYHKNILLKLNTLNDEQKEAAFFNVESYLKGDSELDPAYFSEREILHMADVKLLFDMLKYLLILAVAVFAIMMTFEILSADKSSIAWTLMIGSGLGLVFALIKMLFLWLAFGPVFFLFHKLFFSNDLWLLDPTSMLIQIFPEPFFSSLIISSITTTILLSLAACIGSGLYLYNKHLQEKKSWGKMWRVY